MNKRKLYYAITGIVLLILALTNPSVKDFKDFVASQDNICGKSNPEAHVIFERVGCYGREANFIIFSIFTFSVPDYCDNFHGKYLGILKNFYWLNSSDISRQKAQHIKDSLRLDSIQKVKKY